MSTFWNQRYAVEEYVYGTEPNKFFKQQIENIRPGKILFPAEGEGRNAVFAALKGWEVTAFDSSTEGKRKAELLARKNKVSINYIVAQYDEINFEPEKFDCLVLVFAHIEASNRQTYHRKLLTYLKPGGILILEGFSKNQIKYNSGGPREIEMLFSANELINDFDTLKIELLEEKEIELNEGEFHSGKAAIISLRGVKSL